MLHSLSCTLQAIAEYSADCMRWTLADAGDSLEDANFETSTANAVILRMTKELAWIDEMLAPGAGGRGGVMHIPCYTDVCWTSPSDVQASEKTASSPSRTGYSPTRSALPSTAPRRPMTR